MYVNAIRVYQKLLEKESKDVSGEMRERIFHNQGCAYSSRTFIGTWKTFMNRAAALRQPYFY